MSDVIVKITSGNATIEGASYFDLPVCYPLRILESACVSKRDYTTIECIGTVCASENGVRISYTEPSFEESPPCKVEILCKETGEVKITRRSSEVESGFTVKEGERKLSLYSTPYGKFKMCTWAKKVDVSLDDKLCGIVSLDYAVELSGLSAQRTKMKIQVFKK